MTITRDFDAMLAEQAGVRPTFKVGGQEFTLRAKLPYTKWNKLVAHMRADDTDAMEATSEFFNTVLIRSDRERFAALLEQEDDDSEDEVGVIGLSQMDALTDWVMEYFTGKLQSSSNGSSPGANGTGQQRNVVSLSSRNTAG
jgi:hypothetical protein